MNEVYFFCAVLGGGLVALQFLATLFGLGGGELSGGADGDAGELDASTDDGGFAFVKAFSFRSLSAGVAFFGLAGRAASEFGWAPLPTFHVAVAVGAAAIFGVFYLMKTLASLRFDGSIKTETAIGKPGSVYLRVPGKRAGLGKIEIVQQGRTMEYDAATDEPDDLPIGTPIVVVRFLSATQALVAKSRDDARVP